MENNTLVEARGLSRLYGPNVAVDNLSISLQQGEILGLLGPNGAGKSTTMKMLTGNLAPSAGSVRIAGVDMLAKPKAAKAHLGYLPEQPPVHPECTVDEYLAFTARLHGVRGKAVTKALDRAKTATGLGPMSQRLVGNLSKGYQQRVGIAQAIIHAPKVVILDEPSVGLDPQQIIEIRSLIKGLAQECGVILSSHILSEIQAICSRVCIIHKGRMVFDEPMSTFDQEPQQRLGVVLGNPPSELRLPGLERATVTGIGRFELLAAPGIDLRPALVEASVAQQWKLLALQPLQRTLEEVFLSKIREV